MTSKTSSDISLQFVPEFEKMEAKTPQDAYVLVTLKAPEVQEKDEDKRDPIDLIVVLDRSGSMGGTPMNLAKKSLKFAVQQLKPNDRISIVTYANNVTTVVELTTVDNFNTKATICKKIDAIRASGSTNLSGGLQTALESMRSIAKSSESRVRSICLFTDGHANAGLSNDQTLNMVSSRFSDLVSQCSINTFGFSGNHDATFLQNLAERSNGSYYYIKDSHAIGEALVSCLGGLLSVVAKEVMVTLKVADPSITLEKVHTTFATTTKVAGKEVDVNLFDLQSEEQRDLFIKLVLPASTTNSKTPVLVASVVYQNCQTKQKVTKKLLGYVSREMDCPKGKANSTVEQERNRVIAVETMKKVNSLGSRGLFGQAKDVLRENMQTIQESSEAENARDYLQDLQQCNDFLAPQAYASGGAQALNTNFSGWGRQRSTVASQQSMKKFSNKKKSKLLGLFG